MPGDAEWPGAKVHPGYTFDVDAHVKDLLGQAMDAAKAVAENITLAQNTGVLDQVDPASPVAGINPYFEMYALQDMSGVDEILMWKAFGEIDGKAMTNGIASFITSGSCNFCNTHTLCSLLLRKYVLYFSAFTHRKPCS